MESVWMTTEKTTDGSFVAIIGQLRSVKKVKKELGYWRPF
jgi:hypothetical protein